MSKPFDLPSAMDRLTDERLRQALAEVKRALVETIGPEFRLILFGSRARGDAEPDSDVDLMVILPDEAYTFENRRTIHNVAADIALERDYVFCPLIVSERIAKEHAGFMVFGAVEKEGISL